MGIADRLKELTAKAVDATAEHSDKIQEVVEKVATTADKTTGGKYHERIQQAGAKAGGFVDGLKAPAQQTGTDDAGAAAAAGRSPTPPAGAPAPADAAAPATDAPSAPGEPASHA